MTKHWKNQIKELYRENEDSNNHAVNYLLLAKFYESKPLIRLAKMNLDRRARLGYACPKLSAACHRYINPLYYALFA